MVSTYTTMGDDTRLLLKSLVMLQNEERDEVKKKILAGIVWTTWPERPKGGQQVNWMPTGWKLTHPDWSFEIACNEFRTSMQNREFCLTVFELFLDDFIR